MELEEAKKILLNCYPMKTTHVLDDTNKANKEAIEVVLKEIEEREKRYWKREERFLDMYNREKEKHEEIYNDLLDERDDNYIPKDKIREIIEELNKDIEEEFKKCSGRGPTIALHSLTFCRDEFKELLEEG